MSNVQLRSSDSRTIKTATLTEVICAAIDVYHAHHPELAASDVFEALHETYVTLEQLHARALEGLKH